MEDCLLLKPSQIQQPQAPPLSCLEGDNVLPRKTNEISWSSNSSKDDFPVRGDSLFVCPLQNDIFVHSVNCIEPLE